MNLFDMAFNKMLENLHYLDLELMIQAMEAVEEKKDEEIFGKKGTTNWQTKKVLLRCFKKVVNMLSEKIVLSPEEIYEKEFKVDARGYRPQEVDNFLDLIIKDYSEFIKMTRSYEKEITVLNEENAKLKATIRKLEAELEAREGAGNSSQVNNVDLLRRISQLEKIVYSKMSNN